MKILKLRFKLKGIKKLSTKNHLEKQFLVNGSILHILPSRYILDLILFRLINWAFFFSLLSFSSSPVLGREVMILSYRCVPFGA